MNNLDEIIHSPNFKQKTKKFGEILSKFNKIHSLTKYENLEFVMQDSLNGLKFITNSPKIAIDVGSGAGFPAIFLALVLKDCKWHLFEPNVKKSSFLTYTKINLGLENVIIHSKKIEDETKFVADLITSRALMRADLLLEICKGFYNKETLFLLYKGSNAENEIKNLKDYKLNRYQNRVFLTFKGDKNG